jgi:rRNA-processing protein FCF1
MKTKLTLNISDKVIKKAKQVSAKKRLSLSSVVEEYLSRFSNTTIDEKPAGNKKSIIERIRKFTKPVIITDSEIKEARAKHLQTKYGK